MRWLYCFAVTVVTVALPVQADWSPDYIGGGAAYTADAEIGSAVQLGWAIDTDWLFTARLERNSHTRQHSVNLVNFDESFSRTSVGLFAEYLIPSDSNLRLVGGALHFDKASEWVARPNPTAVYQLNDRYYSGLQLGTPEATIKYRSIVPYVGLSWTADIDAKAGRGWAVNIEAGAMFNLDPQLTIRSDNPAGLPLLAADLQHEADQYVERLKSDDEFLESVAPRIGITAIYQF